mgnify:CR=1 FL=1
MYVYLKDIIKWDFKQANYKHFCLNCSISNLKVLIPFENQKDLVEIPKDIKKNIEIIPVKNVDEVLKHALTKPLKRVQWTEVEQISKDRDQKPSVGSVQ